MDFKHETEIKDEILEFNEDDGKITHCLDQVLRNDELQMKGNIITKSREQFRNETYTIHQRLLQSRKHKQGGGNAIVTGVQNV
ncbi:UNVERIFIED_CONTAM: hypothetical protein RMT77_015166 [Armadillidium vulgare]